MADPCDEIYFAGASGGDIPAWRSWSREQLDRYWREKPVPIVTSPALTHREFFFRDDLGLPTPPAVRAAGPRSPWIDTGHIDAFVEDRCEHSPSGERVDTLYAAYRGWCAEHGRAHVVEAGPFVWHLRKTFDSASGRDLHGNWLIGLALARAPRPVARPDHAELLERVRRFFERAGYPVEAVVELAASSSSRTEAA